MVIASLLVLLARLLTCSMFSFCKYASFLLTIYNKISFKIANKSSVNLFISVPFVKYELAIARTVETSSTNPEVLALLRGILQAISGLAVMNKDNTGTQAMKNLFIPSSEAFNPNEAAMTLLGSRLCVGL